MLEFIRSHFNWAVFELIREAIMLIVLLLILCKLLTILKRQQKIIKIMSFLHDIPDSVMSTENDLDCKTMEAWKKCVKEKLARK